MLSQTFGWTGVGRREKISQNVYRGAHVQPGVWVCVSRGLAVPWQLRRFVLAAWWGRLGYYLANKDIARVELISVSVLRIDIVRRSGIT